MSLKGILLLVLAGVGFGLLIGTSFHKPASLPTEQDTLSNVDDVKKLSDQAGLAKLHEEVKKLREETKGLQGANEALDVWYRKLMTALAGLGGIIVGLIVYLASRSLNTTQQRKIEEDKEQGHETHLLDLFNDLGDKEPKIRIGAVAILVQRITTLREEILAKPDDPKPQAKRELGRKKREVDMIVSVLISITKHEDKDQIQKYIADGLANALSAIVPDNKDKPDDLESPLKKYDFQGAKLENVWWKHIDARGVDFYGAHLQRAGLRKAFLSGAKLRKANLKDATMVEAHLETIDKEDPTDLQEAQLPNAKLSRAKLSGANIKKANLKGADLTGADLTGADLTEVDMSDAELDGADLRGAKTTGVIIKGTNFGTANLCGVDLRDAHFDNRTAFDRITRDDQTLGIPP